MSRAKTILIVRLILEHEDKVLLLGQTSQNGGHYTLIGGKVDAEETAVDALIRESEEEAGVVLSRKKLRLVHVIQRIKPDHTDLIMVFRAKKWKGDIRSREPEKFKKTKWFKMEELPTNLLPLVKHIFKKYKRKEFYSEYHR